MFKLNELLDIVKLESNYHKEQHSRLSLDVGNGGDSNSYYRHKHLAMAMDEIHERLSEQHDNSEIDTNIKLSHSGNIPVDIVDDAASEEANHTALYLDNIPIFKGLNPFDTNLDILVRIDAGITFIMSDGNQRNSKAIASELRKLFPDGDTIKDDIVGRRAYVLCKKKGLLISLESRGYYRITDKYSMKNVMGDDQ